MVGKIDTSKDEGKVEARMFYLGVGELSKFKRLAQNDSND